MTLGIYTDKWLGTESLVRIIATDDCTYDYHIEYPGTGETRWVNQDLTKIISMEEALLFLQLKIRRLERNEEDRNRE